jgi:hypothetical protein
MLVERLRKRLNDGCRTIPSSVISEYAISASKRDSTQVESAFLSGLAIGDVRRASGLSASRIARAVFWSQPVQTREPASLCRFDTFE